MVLVTLPGVPPLRTLLVTGASALLLTALPAPARADDGQVFLDSEFGASAVAAGSAGKDVPVWYRAGAMAGTTLPATITATIVASPTLRLTPAGPNPGCNTSGAVTTCTREPGPAFAPGGDLRLTLSGTAAGTVTITVTAPGVETSERTYDIAVTEPGPDLQVGNVAATAAPGGSTAIRPSVHNGGDRSARTVLVTFYTGSYLTFGVTHSNCRYRTDAYGFTQAVCLLQDVDLRPGEGLTATNLRARISPHVPGQLRNNRYEPAGKPYTTYVSYTVEAFDAVPADERLGWPAGTGTPLTWARSTPAARAALAVDPRDDWATAIVTVAPDNPSDMVAEGTTVRGRVGDVVTLTVGVRNAGPADVSATPAGKGGDEADPYNAGLRFAVPAGVQVVEVLPPPGFAYQSWTLEQTPAGPVYRVLPYSLKHGERYAIRFTVRLTAAGTSAGSVVAQGGTADPCAADSTARVTVVARR
jgi:hypothetical protein